MAKEFTGHLAFVTGGSSGLGEQICRDLAAEGASVVVADIQSELAVRVAASLPTEEGNSHLGLQLDVSKKSEVQSALDQVITTYGRPADLIVNSAGVTGVWFPFEDTPEEDIDQVMDVNFKGTYLVTQVFGKALLDAKMTGSIVNMSSVLGYTALARGTSYCTSKAAVMHFTKVVAMEWGPRGIRVNSIHPGLIDTSMGRKVKPHIWERYPLTASLRRHGTPKDVSNTVLFALSEKSAFTTGAQFDVTGQGSLTEA